MPRGVTGTYQGVGMRLVAASIDLSLLIFFVTTVYNLAIFSTVSLFEGLVTTLTISLILYTFYEIFFVHRLGGTVGKLLVKMEVVDLDGNYPSPGRSVLRFVSKWASLLTFGTGYLLIAWDSTKQALHDKIANTYVVSTSSRGLSKHKLRVAIVSTYLVLVFGYLLMQLSLFSLGYQFGFERLHSVDVRNPVGNISAYCNERFWIYKDACFRIYINQIPDDRFNLEVRLDLCAQIASDRLHALCLASAATSYQNPSICADARSQYYEQLCDKSYEEEPEEGDYLETRSERDVNGTLEYDSFSIGYDAGYCVFTDEDSYHIKDTLCFQLVNVSPFAEEDGKSMYDVDLRIWRGDQIIRHSTIVNDNEVELANGTFESVVVVSEVDTLGVGNYTFELFFYDQLSTRAVTVAKHVNLVPPDLPGQLFVPDVVFGVTAGSFCTPKERHVFAPSTQLCMQPRYVAGFEEGPDGLHWFDMDETIMYSNGTVLSRRENLYGVSGHTRLRQDVLDGFFSALDLDSFAPGVYNYEVTVKDMIGRKQSTIIRTFTVANQDTFGLLAGGRVQVGLDEGRGCVPDISNQVSLLEDKHLCFALRNIRGFESDPEGLIRFDVGLAIYRDGVAVESGASSGSVQPINGALDGYLVLVPLYKFETGDHTYELTVVDKLNGRSSTLRGGFRLV